ncbi:MAG: AraC family transcriptional regulator [Firmicutes bacterium]|nr:AraC family transcriptional regulator [Bacillota bacterium]
MEESQIINFQNASGSFEISYKKAMGHYTMPSNHFHDGYEIYYLLSGERYYFIKERTFYIKKGELVLINAYDLHKTMDTGVPNHERILIKFNPQFVLTADIPLHQFLAALFKVNVIQFSIPAQNLVEEILTKMLQESRAQKTGFEIILQSLLLQLLVYATRYTEANVTYTFEHPSPNHQKISEIVQYINENYPEAISLSSVAELFYVSPYYLSRIFKKVTGFTFVEYLNSVRVKEAQKLLRESKLNVLRIAEKVGFGSIAHFGRVFKSVTGYSALHYRRLNRV